MLGYVRAFTLAVSDLIDCDPGRLRIYYLKLSFFLETFSSEFIPPLVVSGGARISVHLSFIATAFFAYFYLKGRLDACQWFSHEQFIGND